MAQCPRCGAPAPDQIGSCAHCGAAINPFAYQGQYQQPVQGPPPGGHDPNYHGIIPYKNGMALAAYYTGIFGFCFPIVGTIALVLGIIGFRNYLRDPSIKGQVHAWVGIIAGGLSTILYALFFIGMIVAVASKP